MSRTLVVLSNRGPVSWYVAADGSLRARRGAGGLVSALTPALSASGGTWIATAMSDADRRAAAEGLAREADTPYAVRLLDVPPDVVAGHGATICNRFLWFAHHDLWDRARTPVLDRASERAWDDYVAVNEVFAAAALAAVEDTEEAAVLVQDYHLTLVPRLLKAERPDLRVLHFSHTPIGTVPALDVLPDRWLEAVFGAMAAADVCGFHTRRWASRFAEAAARWAPGASPTVGVFPLGTDPAVVAADAAGPTVEAEREALTTRLAGRRAVVRVDRAELSKNVLRGLRAFDLLLDEHPEHRDSLAHVVLLNPSRQGVPEYEAYLEDVLALAADVNRRWGEVVLASVKDDFPRSMAALRLADVIVVNPISDGMNLVAKEGPLVNEKDAPLILSTEAGAHEELAPAVLTVDPYDVAATAAAMAAALALDPATRAQQAGRLRSLAGAHPPAEWLAGQLEALGR